MNGKKTHTQTIMASFANTTRKKKEFLCLHKWSPTKRTSMVRRISLFIPSFPSLHEQFVFRGCTSAKHLDKTQKHRKRFLSELYSMFSVKTTRRLSLQMVFSLLFLENLFRVVVVEGHKEGMRGRWAENAHTPVKILPPDCSITQSLRS